MASPFATRANARIRWQQGTALPDLREGLTAATELVVIEAFLTLRGVPDRQGAGAGAAAEGLPSAMAAESQPAIGYVTRWAVVPTGATWLDSGAGWTWDTTGLRPPSLVASNQEAQLYFGPLAALPTPPPGSLRTITFLQVTWDQGDGGIGAQLRSKAGDRFQALVRGPR